MNKLRYSSDKQNKLTRHTYVVPERRPDTSKASGICEANLLNGYGKKNPKRIRNHTINDKSNFTM